MRLQPAVREALERRARDTGQAKGALAAQYIDEGVKRDEHPAIIFRDGPLGRRALLAGTRLEVWQVIETLRNSGNVLEDAASYLGLPSSLVRACLAYYAAYQQEVDAYADRAREAADRAEAAWRREQELLSG